MHCFTQCVIWKLKMSVQHNLFGKFMLYKSELGHNVVEAIKNIFCEKGEGAIDLVWFGLMAYQPL